MRPDREQDAREVTCEEALKAVGRLRDQALTGMLRHSALDVVEACLRQQAERIKRLERQLGGRSGQKQPDGMLRCEVCSMPWTAELITERQVMIGADTIEMGCPDCGTLYEGFLREIEPGRHESVIRGPADNP